jgi:hypothetical protein
MSPTLAAYTNGQTILYKAGATNTTTHTLNADGLGAKSVLTAAAGALAAGDVTSGRYYLLTYNGTQFLLPAGGGTTYTGTTNEVTVTGTVLSLSSTMDLTSKIVRVPNSTSRPGTCTVGDSYMDTDATSGSRWYLCESTNTWVAQGGAAVATQTGPYNLLGGFSLNGSYVSAAANRVVYAMFTLPVPRSFTGYKFWCSGAGGSCGNQGFAIYDSSYNLVANSSASVDGVGSGGVTSLAIGSTITLQPGKYYTAWTTSVTTAVLYGTPDTYFGNLNSGESSPDFAFFYGANASTGSAAPFTFPSTIGTQTAINTSVSSPWIGVK